MTVDTAAQCDWLSLLTNGSLIPLSALVAIVLFIIRELLDWYRKSQSKKNEINALKKIFARECQLAWSVCVTIKKLCEQFAPYEARPMNECPLNFSITKTTAGKTRYTVKENGQLSSGGVLNKPSLNAFKKYLFDILKLDSSFYGKSNSAFSAVIELQHFYESLVDNDDTSQLMGLNSMMYGFSGYALKEIEWVEKDIKGLYQYCTGEELTKGLLR